MSQSEVLEQLYKKRVCNDESYFTVAEISIMVTGSPSSRSIRKQVTKLFLFGFLEAHTESKIRFFTDGKPWKRGFRLKNNHLKTVESMLKVDNSKTVSKEVKNLNSEKSIKETPIYT
jgi:hypothetical protein